MSIIEIPFFSFKGIHIRVFWLMFMLKIGLDTNNFYYKKNVILRKILLTLVIKIHLTLILKVVAHHILGLILIEFYTLVLF